MSVLTKEQILAAEDRVTETVPVPEWGGDVIVQSITAHTKEVWEDSLASVTMKNRKVILKQNKGNVRAKLVSLAAIDESGALLFSEQDITALGKKNAAALDRVFEVAKRLAGITDEDVEQLEKNSDSDLSDSSATD